ncbi:hepcidin-1-like [Dendropsophus ebraccatus]|uniref:hepcidin-1-like n=1 Tax=Dendropsophus ebraccatus TaxID=150705 RepID=UPI003831BFED
MKSLSLCLLLLLSLIAHQGLSASVMGNEIMNSADHLTPYQSEETEVQTSFARSRRHTGLSICLYCCKCCKNKGCGYCCRT